MSDVKLNATMGFLWYQTEPNTKPLPLGCHDVGDIAQPQGAVATRYCPDPSGPGKWNVALRTQGPPGEVTATVTTYVGKVADWLQKVKCSGALYVHQSECSRKDVFTNYDAGNLLYEPLFANKSKSNLASREGADASEQSFDLSAKPPLSEYWKLVVTRKTTTEAANLLDIAACGEDLCWGACGPSSELCEDLCAVAAAVASATANMQCSSDAGNTWAAGAADPFAADEDIASIVCVVVDRNTVRRIVARGTTDAVNPIEIGYSDDEGATWTLVDVGATNGEYAIGGGALAAVNHQNIWLVTDQGAIYKSEDGGLTWTEQTTTNTTQLNYVHFVDEHYGIAVGNTNVILSTEDGGDHWTVETGPAAQAAVNATCCRILDAYRWWVGYADGEIYYTNDGGTNWSQRTLPSPNGAASVDKIADMDFLNHFHGCLAVDWTDGSANDRGAIYRTVNGGYDWEIYEISDSFDADGTPGLKAIIMCDENTIWAVGDLIDSTAAIYTAQPAG